MVALEGVSWIDTRVAAVTVSDAAGETTGPKVAVMLVGPAPTAVARPFEPDALLMVATPVAEEAQVTVEVRSWIVLSVKVPVAVNCSVSPLAMLGVGGVTAMDTSVASVTVRFTACAVT